MNQLSFLPTHKQQEIGAILQIILTDAKPEKVILFGSHARNTWVEDEYTENGIRFSYISDYDFLVVLGDRAEKEEVIASRIESHTQSFKNAVSPLIYGIDYINQGLRDGQYFFIRIIREGILLYDNGKAVFAEPKILTEEELRERSRAYYENWFTQGSTFLRLSNNCLENQELKPGVFLLHQATESFYNALLLVYTGYKPKIHNLQYLRNHVKYISPALYRLFRTPIDDPHEYRLFDLLKRGYLDARYKLDYAITEGELAELIDQVSAMKTEIEKLCRDKI